MKSYTLKPNSERWSECTLYVIDTDTRDRQTKTQHVLPMVVGTDGWSASGSAYAIAMTLLLEYFGDEENAGRKAATMAWALTARLRRTSRYGWTMTEAEVNDIVAGLLVTAAECIQEVEEQMSIEEVCGQPRGLIRGAALVETTRSLAGKVRVIQ